MSRNIPSLLALRYFEAAGRNLSFKLAAEELNVTQAAVSHQIRFLETHLAVRLFRRLHQRVELTGEGEELLEATTEYFDGIEEACGRINARRGYNRVHLSITPLLLSRWLLPDLEEFLGPVPMSDIVLRSSLAPPAEDDQGFDLKIFFSSKEISQSGYTPLMKDLLVPMCHPCLLKDLPAHDVDTVIRSLRLVHEFDHQWWEQWLTITGLDPKRARRGIVVNDPGVLENAALLGKGLILGSTMFLAEHLASGRLVQPFEDQISLPVYYYMFAKPASQKRKRILQLSSWLLVAGRNFQSNRDRVAMQPSFAGEPISTHNLTAPA